MEKRSLLYILLIMVILTGCQAAGQAVQTPALTEAEPPTEVPAPTAIPTSTPIATPQPIPVEAQEGWELVWQDEFDGDSINPENWTYDIGGWGWGNGEAQYYTDQPENARVENGLLVIEARFEKYRRFLLHLRPVKNPGAARIPVRAHRSAD